MLVFWILAALMVATAVAFVVVPLLRSTTRAALSQKDVNLEVLRTQRQEIEADVATGTLPASQRELALQELVERAAVDLGGPDAVPEAPAGKPWSVAIASAVLVPILAFGLYATLGSPRAVDPAVVAAAPQPADDQQIVAMVENLARKVQERPDDAQGWALLARSMAAIGRFKESSDAYAHLAKLAPNDAQVLADYADALGMAQGRTLAGKPLELAQAALKIDPNHRKALALVGTARLDAGDFAGALVNWEKLAASMPPDAPDADAVREVIAEIRQRASAAGKPLPPSTVAQAAVPPKPIAAPAPPVAAPAAPKPSAPAGPASVSGSVALAPALAAKVKGGETLFIFARAPEGPRMPLAIYRGPAGGLPLDFTLDDSSAMSPQMKLSNAPAVRIEARISKSGNAMQQAGDLVGVSDVVKPGAKGVRIVIDKEIP